MNPKIEERQLKKFLAFKSGMMGPGGQEEQPEEGRGSEKRVCTQVVEALATLRTLASSVRRTQKIKVLMLQHGKVSKRR